MRPRIRVGVRLSVGLLGLMAALFVVGAGLVLKSRRRTLERELHVQAVGLVQAAAAACTEPMVLADYPVLEDLVEDFAVLGIDVAQARVVREDGEIVADSSQVAPLISDSFYTLSAPIAIDGDELGRIELDVTTARVERQLARDVQDGAALFALLGLTVSFFVYRFLRATVSRPLSQLELAAKNLGAGDLETPIELRSRDELGLLAETMERMRRELADNVRQLHTHNQELERLARTKSALLANTSHEIRTPLTSILGLAEMFEQEELDRDEVREHARELRVSTQGLLALLNDVLDLAKIEAGELVVERRDCDAWQVAEEVVASLRPMAEGKGVALRLVADGPQPRSVLTDPTRLRQVLLQVVGNAVKFTAEGEVVLRFREPQRDPVSDRLVVAVEDTGIGIPPEELEHLFERFHQVDGDRNRRYGGSGLGLSVASEILTLLGGDITVASTVGRGSTFTVRLPLGSLEDLETFDPRTDSGVRLASEAPVVGGKVLIVEDVATNRMLLARALERAGYTVATAEHGELGLEAVLAAERAHEPFDLVLMDIQMPVMDGYEATRRIRASGSTVPIVALTAHSVRGDQDRCIAAGCNDYATKPIARPQLVALAQRHARRRVPA